MTARQVRSLRHRSVGGILMLVLIIALAGCVRMPRTIVAPADEVADTQRRVNEYFHADVVPRLRTCWGSLRGTGLLVAVHTYTRDGTGDWVPGQLTTHTSTLPAGQDDVAIGCLREAVKDTSLTVGPSEAAARELLLFWTWPVPLPANDVVLKGKGCDGMGLPAFCQDCTWDEDFNAKCRTVCVGWASCTATDSTCTITLRRCASGGLFWPIGALEVAR
jgi:hypothetical protein